MAMILLAVQAMAQNVEDERKYPTHLDILNEIISRTQRLKAKVATLDNSTMAQECIKAYDLSLGYLNKAVDKVNAGKPNVEELKTIVKEAFKAERSCDYKDTESTASKQADNN
ncbi:hypothetical protein PTKIN_Ptkin19aG0048400 [Pterospermum kingtungense]